MDFSTKISERMWNLPDKGELEAEREKTFIDDIVQKAHIERELLQTLDGIETVFDGGAGCGRFSILLAKKGIKVTHFDISQPMIDKAKEIAEREGVIQNITFVKGALEDLADYADNSFDLVMSFDSTNAGLTAMLDSSITINTECNPLHGPRVSEIIQALEKGESVDKMKYVDEEIFAADDSVKSVTIDGTDYPVTAVTQAVIDARAY